MKNIKIIILLLVVAIIYTSCDSTYEEVNTDPDNPTNMPANLFLSGILRNTGNQITSSFLAGEAGSEWSQHLSKTVYNDADYYIPRQNAIQSLWTVSYSSILKDADVMQRSALADGNSDLQGVALVIKAFTYQYLADSFGDIPMSEALSAENFTPKYDKCEDVYTNIIAMLTEADSLLNGSGSITTSQDLIYGGDWSKWKMFANSLKFRVIMRASGNSSYAVGTQLQDIVDAGNLFMSNSDQAVMTYLSAEPNANPYYEALVNGGRTGEWCLGEELVNKMLASSDPRLPVYAQEVEGNGSGNGYRGKPAGISNLTGTVWNSAYVSWIGEKYLEAEAPALFMTYSQLEFLMAEAAERGYISGGSAEAGTHYANGITASCDFNGVGVGSFNVSYSGGASGLQEIAEQEWVALYMQGLESWAEQRRTGFPVLPLAADAAVSTIPTRFNYPGTEQSLNANSYTNAVAVQGPDELTTLIWWQK